MTTTFTGPDMGADAGDECSCLGCRLSRAIMPEVSQEEIAAKYDEWPVRSVKSDGGNVGHQITGFEDFTDSALASALEARDSSTLANEIAKRLRAKDQKADGNAQDGRWTVDWASGETRFTPKPTSYTGRTAALTERELRKIDGALLQMIGFLEGADREPSGVIDEACRIMRSHLDKFED